MIPILRYMSIGLWGVILWALPLGFWLLPRAGIMFSGLSETWAMAFFLTGAGVVQGLVLDSLGRKRIKGLIREGEVWQQAGLRSKAEQKYIQAIRMIDSPLIFPWPGRKIYPELNRVLAGFYLTGEVGYPGFKAAGDRYLRRHPQDETLVLLWLERFAADPGPGIEDVNTRSLLAAMADAHHNNPKIALKLAGPCLETGKEDISALRLFRSVLRILEGPQTDAQVSKFPLTLKEQILDLLDQAEKTSSHPGKISGDREPPGQRGVAGPTLGDQVFPVESPGGLGKGKKGSQTSGAGIISSVLSAAVSLPGSAWAWVGKERKIRQYIKNAVMLGMAVWLGFFIYSSLVHMLKSTGSDPPKYSVGASANGPFTIQVAAYVKVDHADQYVKNLERAGVLAHIKKTTGGGQTWYLVRISSFQDKESAAAYGQELKSQGKIQDFFVSNI